MRRSIRPFKKILDYLSLKYKLFILLLAISIIPITLVSYSSQHFMFKSSTEYSASISSQYVDFVSKDISNYLQDLSHSFDELFTNSDFQKFLDTPSDDLVAQADHIINFQPILKNPLQFHNEILGVLYLDQMGKVYFDSYQKELNYNYVFQNDPQYKTIFQMNQPELTLPHAMNYTRFSQDNVFSFVRPIINLNTGKVFSWLIVEIREDKINNMLSGTKFGQGGQLLLYHGTTNVAISRLPIGQVLLQDFKRLLGTDSGKDNEFIFTSRNIQYEATYANIPYGNWKLIWMAPLSSITKGVQQSSRLTLLIAVASLTFALIIAFPVMNFVLLPLYKLKAGMKSLGRGAYVPIQIQPSNDEIGFLVKSYNQTLGELQRMEQEVYQAKFKEKERELLQLQAQINPHFLFNTLETIESYATRNNGDAVGEMVQSVARMMRYNVRNDGGFAPLKEEIAYIHHFLKIHYYRNGIDVTAKFELDPASLDIPVMKLSIQPFVENAMKYGWSPTMTNDEFTLTVKVTLQEEKIHISIKDTGTGIPSQTLDKLIQMIHSNGDSSDPYFQKHTGIYNVYRRFTLAYGGEHIHFDINSSSNKGTIIELQVPYYKLN